MTTDLRHDGRNQGPSQLRELSLSLECAARERRYFQGPSRGILVFLLEPGKNKVIREGCTSQKEEQPKEGGDQDGERERHDSVIRSRTTDQRTHYILDGEHPRKRSLMHCRCFNYVGPKQVHIFPLFFFTSKEKDGERRRGSLKARIAHRLLR